MEEKLPVFSNYNDKKHENFMAEFLMGGFYWFFALLCYALSFGNRGNPWKFVRIFDLLDSTLYSVTIDD